MTVKPRSARLVVGIRAEPLSVGNGPSRVMTVKPRSAHLVVGIRAEPLWDLTRAMEHFFADAYLR